MNLKQQAVAKIEEAYKLAEAHYGRTFTRVPVKFSNKMTRAAGYARISKGKPHDISLSTKILDLNPEEFLNSTPGHEAAHLIAFEQFGTMDHGPTWREVMRVIKHDPRRCHTMEVPKRANGVTYHCDCKEHELTRQRHNKILRGCFYTCNNCKARLVQGKLNKETTVKVPTVKTARKVVTTKTVSKAAQIRVAIAYYKEQGLDRLSATRLIISKLQKELDMPTSAMRSSISHNWDKV